MVAKTEHAGETLSSWVLLFTQHVQVIARSVQVQAHALYADPDFYIKVPVYLPAQMVIMELPACAQHARVIA